MERDNEPINGGLIELLERFRLLNVLRSENQSTLVEVEGIPSGGVDASASNLLGKRRSGLVRPATNERAINLPITGMIGLRGCFERNEEQDVTSEVAQPDSLLPYNARCKLPANPIRKSGEPAHNRRIARPLQH